VIEWFDKPYAGTDVDGFEVLIHGLVVDAREPSLWAIVVAPEGDLRMVPHGSIKMDWRWTRERGWFGTEEQMANT
jgi:hypothetical protein